jgi:hypothetical protein
MPHSNKNNYTISWNGCWKSNKVILNNKRQNTKMLVNIFIRLFCILKWTVEPFNLSIVKNQIIITDYIYWTKSVKKNIDKQTFNAANNLTASTSNITQNLSDDS